MTESAMQASVHLTNQTLSEPPVNTRDMRSVRTRRTSVASTRFETSYVVSQLCHLATSTENLEVRIPSNFHRELAQLFAQRSHPAVGL